jgi:hypothetical protein
MKKALLLLTLITTTIFSCKRQNAWTPEYEKSIYQTTYGAIGSLMKDSAQRKQLALLMVKRYKQLLPYGLNSISNDSLQKLSSKISREISKTNFAENMQMVVAWSPEVEASFRASLFGNNVWQKIKADAATKDRFCDCLIASLKKIYPDSLVTPVPDSIYTKVVGDCKPIIAAGK